MGAMAKLKAKIDSRYRKGSTNTNQNCESCQDFIPAAVVHGIGADLGTEPRCRRIGMNGSIRYRVREDYTCDHQTMSDEVLEKMRMYRERAPRPRE